MDVFAGFISPFPWNWPPLNWAKCTGTLLTIAQNQVLYSLVGPAFGGNGQTTFALPDLQGRQIIGYGQRPGGSAYPFANAGGHEMITLQPSQTPLAAHTHPATFTAGGGGSPANVSVSTAAPTDTAPMLTDGQTAYLANAAVGPNLKGLYTTTAPAPGATATIPVNGGGGSGTVTVDPNAATSAAPVSLMNPYLALNFCIALTGLYPSRN